MGGMDPKPPMKEFIGDLAKIHVVLYNCIDKMGKHLSQKVGRWFTIRFPALSPTFTMRHMQNGKVHAPDHRNPPMVCPNTSMGHGTAQQRSFEMDGHTICFDVCALRRPVFLQEIGTRGFGPVEKEEVVGSDLFLGSC